MEKLQNAHLYITHGHNSGEGIVLTPTLNASKSHAKEGPEGNFDGFDNFSLRGRRRQCNWG